MRVSERAPPSPGRRTAGERQPRHTLARAHSLSRTAGARFFHGAHRAQLLRLCCVMIGRQFVAVKRIP